MIFYVAVCKQVVDSTFIVNMLLCCSNVRSFLEASVTKMKSVFPLTNNILRLAPIILPNNRAQYTLSDVREIALAFPLSEMEVDSIESEWLDFLSEDEPSGVIDPAQFWGKANSFNKPNLCKLMQSLMALPHSNASSERMFSMLKKIFTDERTQLSHSTITSLLSVKVNTKQCCLNSVFDRDMLKSIKKAARTHNENYRSEGNTNAIQLE